ncbi:hypothetical protein Hanom_Chr04g00365081 [Helianthus anomalus]
MQSLSLKYTLTIFTLSGNLPTCHHGAIHPHTCTTSVTPPQPPSTSANSTITIHFGRCKLRSRSGSCNLVLEDENEEPPTPELKPRSVFLYLNLHHIAFCKAAKQHKQVYSSHLHAQSDTNKLYLFIIDCWFRIANYRFKKSRIRFFFSILRRR